jgi:hypothetical protein
VGWAAVVKVTGTPSPHKKAKLEKSKKSKKRTRIPK